MAFIVPSFARSIARSPSFGKGASSAFPLVFCRNPAMCAHPLFTWRAKESRRGPAIRADKPAIGMEMKGS
ncbi:hypothetical protein AUC45_03350 [Erythrobacter sp. YT30]|nr:hypothetical protein AUC45_03350 [Erythrobacter sp. YT30]